MSRIIGGVSAVLLGLCVIVGGIFLAFFDNRYYSETTAVITEVRQGNDGKYVVSIEYTADGVTYTDSYTTPGTGNAVGNEYRVLYDPDDPSDNKDDNSPAGVLMIVLGAVWVSIAIYRTEWRKKMLYTVKNGKTVITAHTFGAELHSIKFEGREYLWQCGDAWKRYAPVLFPFVCSPEGRNYRAGGKEYTMKANHGFARDSEFKFVKKGDNFVEFVLYENEETFAQYPYSFELTVRYTALENGVRVENIVENSDNKDMYFYLGGHPAFNCPLTKGESFEDYDIVYEKNEHITDPAGNVLAENGSTLAVTRALFDNDAIMIDKPNSKAVTLKSRKSGRAVTVKFPQSDCIAVWSPTGDDNAAFVCLEPWTSVPVYADDAYPDIENKPHAIKLGAGETFSYGYEIEVY